MWHNKAKEIIDLALAKGLISKEDLPNIDINKEHQGYSTTRIEKGLYFLRYLKENNLLTDQLIKNLEKEVDRKKETTSLKIVNLADVQKANALEDKFNENSACSEKSSNSKVNKYQIIGLLGKGGMSKVYKAYDLYLRRFVVMKFTNNEKDQEAIERLLLEARAQAKIEHPNVCKIYDVAKTRKRFFIVSQYIEGETLDEVQPKLSLIDKIQLIIDIANALSTAHAHNIIHRDIKPRNIIVEKTDTNWKPYLIDFGLAKELYQPYLTEYGSILGTPCYMSPEQASGESSKLDCRTDIYSLGATLYELLVDRPPFSGENALSILVKVINQQPIALREIDSSISTELERIVLKCLEKDPKNRYQSTQALIRDLRQYLNLEKKITTFKENKKLLNQEKMLEKSNLPLYMRLITQAGFFICIMSFLFNGNQNNILSILGMK